jgi:hypothetical protein
VIALKPHFKFDLKVMSNSPIEISGAGAGLRVSVSYVSEVERKPAN